MLMPKIIYNSQYVLSIYHFTEDPVFAKGFVCTISFDIHDNSVG